MEEKISPSELELNEFTKIISEISDIDLNERRNILVLKLSKFVSSMGVKTFVEFLSKLQINRQPRQDTLDSATIGETYFLRELSQLKEIIFYAKSLEKTVNILGAPRSSGEEVYSMVVLGTQNSLKDMMILGIDINSSVIEKAEVGKYQGRALQRLSESEERRFFTDIGEQTFGINKSELCTCRFELYNVFEGKFLRLGKFDIIVSKNMMIYFDYDSRIKLMGRFYQIPADSGRLYVGNAGLIPETTFFKKVFPPRGMYYEKI